MKKLSKGFTLIELMIVVAIIGILAAIAIPNFVKYQLRSKFSEASSNIEGLRKAEEALRQGERGVVDPLTNTLIGTYAPGQYWNMNPNTIYPVTNAAVPGTGKIVWTTDELRMAAAIDWQVEGATYFQYAVSTAGCGSPSTPAATDAGVCYSIGARSNIDGDAELGEAALVKLALDPAAAPPQLPAALGLVTAFPGTLGTCITPPPQLAPVYAMPCTLTGPDVF